jgi:hypothetical protein
MSTCGDTALLGLMDSIPLLSLSICGTVSFPGLLIAAIFRFFMAGMPVNRKVFIFKDGRYACKCDDYYVGCMPVNMMVAIFKHGSYACKYGYCYI